MPNINRRDAFKAAAALSIGAAAARLEAAPGSGVAADLERYAALGNKQAGGPGDKACGEWLAGELTRAGFNVSRQEFEVPTFASDQSELHCGDLTVAVYPQPIVRQTGEFGIAGPLVRVDPAGRFLGTLDGAIALVELAHARWSSLMTRGARGPIEAAFAAGARAAVVITTGPTGKLIALNADGRAPMFPGPVALVAPREAEPLLAAAIERRGARLTIRGKGGTRRAFNLIGRIDRGKERWLAISTPRSGWFTCAAERGPGIAAWLDLARFAPGGFPDHDLFFICTTGHEYENLGAAEAMEAVAPPVGQTRFWLHIGANVAARDWHEMNGAPLPSVDSERYLAISPGLLPLARRVFAGQIGYEAPVSSDQFAAGELVEVMKAGYAPAAGVFGIHRFHHTPDDDTRCLHVDATIAAAASFRRLVEAVAANPA